MAERKTIPAQRSESVLSEFRRLDESTFWGFAYWGETPDVRFVIEILIDGEPVALLRAEQFDRGLRDQACGDGCHAFTYIARKQQLAGCRVLQARLANLGNPVGLPIDLAMTVSEPSSAQQAGSVEWVGGLRLNGTAYSRAGVDHVPTIRVFENDVVVTEMRPRRWSGKRSPDDSMNALHIDVHLPADYADGRVHILRVQDDADRELDGSPLTIQVFADGLRHQLEATPALAGEQARALWFDRFLPMSLPFTSYAEWQQRFPRQPDRARRPVPVRVVLIGEDGIDEAIERLNAQSHALWSAAAVPSDEEATFSWADLKEALSADTTAESIAVFAGTKTILDREALAALVAAFSVNTDVAAAYCDLELTGDGGAVQPLFFGAFDYERLLEQSYVSRCFALRIDRIVIPDGEERGSLARLFLGLFDDTAKAGALVCHVPGAFAQIDVGEASAGAGALKDATAAHLCKRGIAADVLPAAGALMPAVRVRRRPEKDGLVSIVIPTRDRVDLLSACIASIRSKTSTVNYEMIIVDNGSVSADTRDFLEACQRNGDRIVSVPGPFNYSHLNNRGVEAARGDYVCLLNNDTEVVDADWLLELLSRLAEPDAGAVAPMLVWPNKMIQHGGIVLGPNFAASDAFNDRMEGDAGYGDLLRVAHESSAVTAACMLVRRKDYLAISGFDETAFPVLFNDVDFCLRLRAAGKRIIVTPHARLIHHESATRKDDHARDRAGRFKRELGYLRNRWGAVLADDPAYSPFLNLDPYPFSALAWPPRKSAPRLGGVTAPARQPAT